MRNYCLSFVSISAEEENFLNVNQKLNILTNHWWHVMERTLINPYFMGFAMQFFLKKSNRLRIAAIRNWKVTYLSGFFSSNLNKKNLILDLDYQNFERQYFFINKLLMEESYLNLWIEKNIHYLIHNTSEKIALKETFWVA